MDSASEALSRTGYAATAPPVLVLWGARALYLGPALGLSAHRNAVAVLAVGLDAPFGVARDPSNSDFGYRTCWSAVIPPNTTHHLQTAPGTMAFLYLDPLSADLADLFARARDRDRRAAYDLTGETELIGVLRDLSCGRMPWFSARARLKPLLSLHADVAHDPRVADAVGTLRRLPASPGDLANLASDAGLSPSRFLHLFKQTTGVPFRRYKIWCRIGTAIRRANAGSSLTAAAHEAGFSSSAHFSATFRDMFGISPTLLKLSNIVIVDGDC